MIDDCAICLFFDDEMDESIRRLWSSLADQGVCSEMPDARWRPHITLSGCNQLDISAYLATLQEFAAVTSVLPVVMSSVGFFASQNSTLFLAPTVSRALLDLHDRHHSVAARFALQMSPHYLPGRWVPHATIALNLPPDFLVQAVEIVAVEHRLPVVGSLNEIGVVQVARPEVRALRSFPLGE